jgi:NADH dehydrogenase
VRIVVLGGGFAGLWSAVGAARALDELGARPDAVELTLINRDAYHVIRVGNYEPDDNCGSPPMPTTPRSLRPR